MSFARAKNEDIIAAVLIILFVIGASILYVCVTSSPQTKSTKTGLEKPAASQTNQPFVEKKPEEKHSETSAITKDKAALLPAELEEINLVRNMAVGSHGYVAPWTMAVTEDKRCFLLGKRITHAEPDSENRMLIERKEDGYHVYASQVEDERWLPDRWDMDDSNLIPIAKVY